MLLLAPAVIGQPLGLTGKLAMVVVSFGLAVLTLHLVENPSRFAPSLKDSARRSLAMGGVLTAVAVAACLALLMVRPVPVGQGMAASPVAPAGSCRSVSAEKAPPPMSVRDQVMAAVAKSAEPGPVPANLTPALNAIAKPEVRQRLRVVVAGRCAAGVCIGRRRIGYDGGAGG